MAINFPDSPSTGQIFTVGSRSWRYNGSYWSEFSGNATDITVTGNNVDITGTLVVNGRKIPDYTTSRYVQYGNSDWSSIWSGSGISYSATYKGVSITSTGSTQTVRVRMPIDPEASYRIKTRVYQVSGTGRFYCAVNTLNNSFTPIYTDQASSYNYGVALNEALTNGVEYTFESVFEGYNSTTGGNHKKFDPEGNYFDVIYLCNYQGSGQTVIRELEIERLTENRHTSVQSSTTLTGTKPGTLKYVTSNNTMYYRKSSYWTKFSKPLGTQENPASRALDIVASGDSQGDGYYWLQNSNINSGNPFQVYCDMTKDNGGWVLVHTNRGDSVSYMGWTTSNIGLRNQTSPSLQNAYSILSWSDYIKRDGPWQWMVEATDTYTTRYTWGGIFTAINPSYSLVANNPNQTSVAANEWFNVTSFVENSGIGPRVPWVNVGGYSQSTDTALFTTYPGTSSWWGTITQGDTYWGNYHTGPWLSSTYPAPNYKRVWIR